MKKLQNSPDKRKSERTLNRDMNDNLKYLILFNDDNNSFEYVIDALIKECNHNPEQAEQCAYITHYNGKCDIKKGPLKQLKPIHDKLTLKDLTVSIH